MQCDLVEYKELNAFYMYVNALKVLCIIIRLNESYKDAKYL